MPFDEQKLNSGNTSLKKVKIIATLGPASESLEIIRRLALAGVDIFRINLSHAIKEDIVERVRRIRAVEKEIKRPISILGDLVGPKIRIGSVEPGVILENGQRIKIFTSQVYGSQEGFSVNFPQILKNLKSGAEVYLGDGEIKIVIRKETENGLLAQVVVGGELRPRMGFSAHGISMRFPLTEKDEKDIQLLVGEGANALAISFVQHKKDITSVRNLLPKKNPPFIVAKFETLAAVENAREILSVADGLMVARGDLGFSVPLPELPHIQKKLISLAREQAKPVITATQMLESMIKSYLPTRAEVTDVANAILDGTDAVMLSAETAIGKFPVETVEMMASIIHSAQDRVPKSEFKETGTITDAVSTSAIKIADRIGAKLIIAFTQGGLTAHMIARHRPRQTIIALSPQEATIHNLCFSGGVFPLTMRILKNFDEVLSQSIRIASGNGFLNLKKGEPFVICAGAPFGISGSTNLVWVNKV